MGTEKISRRETLTWNDLDSRLFLVNNTVYAFAVDLVLYPSDLLTTRLQADRFSNQKVRVGRLLCDIIKRDGITGLYRGFGVNSLGHFPGQFLYYASYEYVNEQCRRLIPNGSSPSMTLFYGLLSNGLAGLLAECVSAFSYLPTDIVTQRLQVYQRTNPNVSLVNATTTNIIKHVYSTEGVRGFFRGFGPYIMVYGPSSAVWWAGYEASKAAIFKLYRVAGLEVSEAGDFEQGTAWKVLGHFLSGALAGAAGFIAVNPLEVAKTRLQLLELDNSKEKRALRNGYLNLLHGVYKNEGFSGLYKGIKPRLIIRVPVSAVAFVGYEYLKEASIRSKT